MCRRRGRVWIGGGGEPVVGNCRTLVEPSPEGAGFGVHRVDGQAVGAVRQGVGSLLPFGIKGHVHFMADGLDVPVPV